MSLLPTEVLELVFARLADDNDALRACSLVSSEFLPVARRFLFGHVFLLPESRQPVSRSYSLASRTWTTNINQDCIPGPRSESLSPYVPTSRSSPVAHRNPQEEPPRSNACAKLDRLISISPTIVRYIQRVTVVDGRVFPSQDPPFHNDSLFTRLTLGNIQSPHHFEIRDRLNGPQWFLSTPPRIIYSLFQKLHVRAFDLVFQDGPRVRWDDIPRDIRGALNCLFASPSLHTLELRRVSWDTPATLREFTSTLSQGSIKHLTLQNVKLLSTTPSLDRKRPVSSRYRDRGHPERSGSQQNRHYGTRGRSPTPRNDSPPLHTLYTQAQVHHAEHHARTCPTLLSGAKLNQISYMRQNQNQSFLVSSESCLSPYNYLFRLPPFQHDHENLDDDDSESDEVLCLDSLAITGCPSSRDPDTSLAALDLLCALLLSQSSGPMPWSNCQLHPISGNQSPLSFTSNPGLTIATRHAPFPHGLDNFVNVEGPLVNPYTLKKLSIPDVELERLPEVFDTLQQCGVIMTGLEELILNNRLSGSPTPPSPINSSPSTAASEATSPSVIDFSTFQNLRTLRLGAHIPPTFDAPSTPFHRLPLTSRSLAPPAALHYKTTSLCSAPGYAPVGHLSWLSQALPTLPQCLEKLSIQFTIEESTHEDEVRHVFEQLRTIGRQRRRMHIDVSKKFVSSYQSGSGNGGYGGHCAFGGRGRGRSVRDRGFFR